MTGTTVAVAISKDFLTAFAKLPKHVQGKTTEFVNKFMNDPRSSGIHYEKLKNGADPKVCSVRIDDTYRGIVVRQEETGVYLLLWVDHHDKAYQWAATKRCEVNKETGAIQVFDIVIRQETQSTETEKGTLFAMLSDDELRKLSVPEEQIHWVRTLVSIDDFKNAADRLPGDTYENLIWIAEGFPIDEVLDMLEKQTQDKKPGDIKEALKNEINQKAFVVVEGEEELRKIMAAPLEQWRVFLHPTQRKIVERNYSGSARVLGGAGTGKTVVAMHRAKKLASMLTGHQKILFTTYTANLAADIRENLRKICTIEELRRIDVINMDAWVGRFLHESGFSTQVVYDDITEQLWQEAISLSKTDLGFDVPFYEEEWNRVVIAQEAMSLPKYAKVSRNGRGTRLDRKKRVEIWKVFECYQNLMKERQIRDINYAMYECTKMLQNSNAEPRYEHIIVDEAQDLSSNAFRMLRALAGEEHPNDLFIVGDSHQRIYKNHAVLSHCGINVRGRSSVLKINYRTTEEVRKYAFALLNGIPFDDLDEDQDSGNCCSLTHGKKPDIRLFKDARAEFDFIMQEIEKLNASGVALSDICVVARTNKLIGDYGALFAKAGIETFEIKRSKTDDRHHNGVRIATMHRVKGLEFQYLFVAAANTRIIPYHHAINHTDPVSEAETMTAERCLLYVALTRSQKGAYITGYGKMSEFVASSL